MPSTTFMNLSLEKQEKLLQAATREFLGKSYNEASINQIIKDAGIPRGSFYMYFQDKEELFRYLLSGYISQMLTVIEELLMQTGGDIFAALLKLYDYIQVNSKKQCLGELGVLCGIIQRNSGLQKTEVLEILAPEAILARLADAVNPDLLELRGERDLPDMMRILTTITLSAIYNSLQTPSADAREYLENALSILRRGMEKSAVDAG